MSGAQSLADPGGGIACADRAIDRVGSDANARLTNVNLSASIAIIASGAVGFWRVRADTGLADVCGARVAIVTLDGGGASGRHACDAIADVPRLADTDARTNGVRAACIHRATAIIGGALVDITADTWRAYAGKPGLDLASG